MTLLAGGNSMITGVPGLAKTLLIATVAQVLHLNFKRIQFTPDLMPGDITGSEIIEEDRTTGKRERVFVKGPIFANIILADEINRTPPKTQSALLEAMQERSVTVEGKTYILDKPFFVLATQNPIELEGTYPLPEAQLDRFMFNIIIEYLSEDEEIAGRRSDHDGPQRPVRKDDQRTRDHRVPETRPKDAGGRARDALCRAARPNEPPLRPESSGFRQAVRQLRRQLARVAVPDSRREGPSVDERPLQRLRRRHSEACYPVFRHRILLNFHAESEGVNIRQHHQTAPRALFRCRSQGLRTKRT